MAVDRGARGGFSVPNFAKIQKFCNDNSCLNYQIEEISGNNNYCLNCPKCAGAEINSFAVW